MHPTDYVLAALHDATMDQIVDELEARFGVVVLGVHRLDPGTLMCKRGDITVALGVHRELGWFLREHWDKVPLREPDEGN